MDIGLLNLLANLLVCFVDNSSKFDLCLHTVVIKQSML